MKNHLGLTLLCLVVDNCWLYLNRCCSGTFLCDDCARLLRGLHFHCGCGLCGGLCGGRDSSRSLLAGDEGGGVPCNRASKCWRERLVNSLNNNALGLSITLGVVEMTPSDMAVHFDLF